MIFRVFKYPITVILLFFFSSAHSQIPINSFLKISDTEGDFYNYLDMDDHFGSDVTVIGDFNMDGIEDIVVGANNDDDGGQNKGAVYILLLNSDKSVQESIKISDTEGNFSGLKNNDSFGIAVESIGDLNNDGVSDIAVGANYDSDGGYQRGAVWILFLNANGTVKNHQKINSIHGNLNTSFPDLGSFGSAICSLGDLDNDGVNDIAVGAYRDNTNTVKSGALYILFLNANGTVKQSQKIGEGFGGFTGQLEYEDYFGGQVTPIGDLDSDGIIDIAVSAFQDNDGGNSRGAVWTLFLNADGTVRKNQKISSVSGNFMGILQNGDFFGSALAPLGDVDGDNILDIVVGADRDDGDGYNKGAVWLLFLNTNGTVKRSQKLSSSSDCFKEKLDDSDAFGGSLAVLNALNSSSSPTIISAAVLDDDGGNNKGAVYFLSFETITDPAGGEDQEVCQDHAFLSGNEPINGNMGEWRVLSGTGIVLEPQNPKSQIQNLAPGENKLVWTISNSCGESKGDTVIITFSNFEETLASDGGKDQIICRDHTFLSGNEPISGSIGFWTIISGNGLILNPNDPDSEVKSLSPGENKLMWTITFENCNVSDSDTVILSYFNDDNLSITGEDQMVCSKSITLSTVFAEEFSGNWEVLSGSATVLNPDQSVSVVKNLSVGVNTFKFSLNDNSCQQTSYTISYVYDPLTTSYFPNVITPNGDGKNDALEFKNIKEYPKNKLIILNRWGRILYEKQGYMNDWKGEGLETGIYYIHLNINGCLDYKGWVQILK